MAIIYGLDTEEEITPKKIRDAMIICFKEAHKEILDSLEDPDQQMTEEELDDMKKFSAELVVEQAFEKSGQDFNCPTKESIKLACESLADYAKNFRKPQIITRHFNQIIKILEKCPNCSKDES